MKVWTPRLQSYVISPEFRNALGGFYFFKKQNMWWIDAKKRLEIYRKSNCKCHYCKDWLEKIIMDGWKPTIDHKIPKVNWGNDDIENLVLACSFCNASKCDKVESEMIRYMDPYIEWICRKKELRLYHNPV